MKQNCHDEHEIYALFEQASLTDKDQRSDHWEIINV